MAEKKYEYKGYKPSNSKYVQKYIKDHYKRVEVRFSKDFYENELKPFCDSIGVPMSEFIKDAILTEMNKVKGEMQ